MAAQRDDEEVRGFFEEPPKDVRAGFRVAAFDALADVAEEQGVPVEELVTPERVEELAVAFFRSGSSLLSETRRRLGWRFDRQYDGVLYRVGAPQDLPRG